jgi:glycosyltransferase involved in cell wall biosynthesis
VSAPRVRVLKFLNAFGIGGTERHVVSLCRTLDRGRFDVRLACFARWGGFLKEAEEGRFPISEYRIGGLAGGRAIGQRLRLAAHLRRAGVEIVHTYNFHTNVFAIPAARLAGTPVVVSSIRDTGVYLTPLKQRAQRLACRLADVVLVNADAVREWLTADGFVAERIAVIRNGVDLSRFGPRGDGESLRGEFGVPADAPLVAVLSRLHRMKGLEYFLEAAAALQARHPAVRFLVVGGECGGTAGGGTRIPNGYGDDLQRRARRLGLEGRVLFTGFRIDVPALLAQVAVSVLPSLSEGLSNSLLESMAAGVPVVATRVGGNPEVVEDGVTGVLVPPRDAAALARAIGGLIENRERARAMGLAGRRRAAERFSLERMARDTERLYLGLLERARTRKEKA